MNISVREIEDNLAHHPELLASSVVGMPDERLGERVCCYVVTAAGTRPPRLSMTCAISCSKTACRSKRHPSASSPSSALPMTATGKVLKHELRKDIEGRLKAEAPHAQQVASPR